MRSSVVVLAGIAVLGLGVPGSVGDSLAGESRRPETAAEGTGGEPKLETLLTAELEGVANTEVIVSRVTIPPHSTLPKHWHPGEEFAYVLEGSVVLWQDGAEDVPGQQGDVVKIPLKKVHTAFTGDEGATVLVFRVHERGKPERTLVD